MIFADVFFLVSFAIIGSLAVTNISIFTCQPLAFIVGWVTIVHNVVNKKLDCEYGIWSLPGYLWSTDYN